MNERSNETVHRLTTLIYTYILTGKWIWQ